MQKNESSWASPGIEPAEASPALAARILDAALELGEICSWERLHLFQIARKLDISLDRIRQHYPQKDDLVEAWFDRADRALLSMKPGLDFLDQTETERLHQVIMLWLDALAPHRRLTRQMLSYKLELGHIHLQVLGLLRISRTVQWLREAAQLSSANLRRIVEEIGVSTIFVLTFVRWLHDESPGHTQTRKFLRNLLERAERAAIPFEFLP